MKNKGLKNKKIECKTLIKNKRRTTKNHVIRNIKSFRFFFISFELDIKPITSTFRNKNKITK